jgi:hypothetical protein
MLHPLSKSSPNLAPKPCICASLARPANAVFSSLPPLDLGRCLAPPPTLPPPPSVAKSSSLTAPESSPFFLCPRTKKLVVSRCCC